MLIIDAGIFARPAVFVTCSVARLISGVVSVPFAGLEFIIDGFAERFTEFIGWSFESVVGVTELNFALINFVVELVGESVRL